jgi:hypothetical protein
VVLVAVKMTSYKLLHALVTWGRLISMGDESYELSHQPLLQCPSGASTTGKLGISR